MSDSLVNLKRAMNKTVFNEFTFSDERKKAVKEKIREKHSLHHLNSWEEKTIKTVLESIQREPKHGYDISTFLFQKQEKSFQSNEGELYTLLHLLENKEIITSKWIQEKKYYSLTTKGKKYLATYEIGSSERFNTLKNITEEGSI